MSFEILTGRTKSHLVPLEHGLFIHKDCYDDYFRLKGTLAGKKLELRTASSFRSYEHQRKIWNDKADGKRALRSKTGITLKYDELNCEEIFWAILNWSSIPGSSRHHWGTDIDIYDHSQYKDGKVLKLANEEYQGSGPNSKISDALFEHNDLFYRPYLDGKSYQMELWHLSHKKQGEKLQSLYTYEMFKKSIEMDSELLLKEHILKNLSYLYQRYIQLNGAH